MKQITTEVEHNLKLMKYDECCTLDFHLPIVHVQEESGSSVVEGVAQNFLQLIDQFIVIGGAHATELVQEEMFNIATAIGLRWWPLTCIAINVHDFRRFQSNPIPPNRSFYRCPHAKSVLQNRNPSRTRANAHSKLEIIVFWLLTFENNVLNPLNPSYSSFIFSVVESFLLTSNGIFVFGVIVVVFLHFARSHHSYLYSLR